MLETEWQPGGDELTPTMKLKRRPIEQKYASEIEIERALRAADANPLIALGAARVSVVRVSAALAGAGGSGSNQIGLDTASITGPRWSCSR